MKIKSLRKHTEWISCNFQDVSWDTITFNLPSVFQSNKPHLKTECLLLFWR